MFKQVSQLISAFALTASASVAIAEQDYMPALSFSLNTGKLASNESRFVARASLQNQQQFYRSLAEQHDDARLAQAEQSLQPEVLRLQWHSKSGVEGLMYGLPFMQWRAESLDEYQQHAGEKSESGFNWNPWMIGGAILVGVAAVTNSSDDHDGSNDAAEEPVNEAPGPERRPGGPNCQIAGSNGVINGCNLP